MAVWMGILKLHAVHLLEDFHEWSVQFLMHSLAFLSLKRDPVITSSVTQALILAEG